MIDLAALKTELLTDPTGRGYAAPLATGTDWMAADLLNAVQAGISIDRGVIPAYEIINATVASEWTALSAAERQRYQTLTGAGQVDSSNANVRAAFAAMFAAGPTRTALTALLTRQGSRAEQLFGQSVSVADVSRARAS
jgi:hypothetical protein